MNKRRADYSHLMSIVIVAFFLGCFLLLIVFGTDIYRHVADSANNNSERRILSSYLLTVAKSNENAISTSKTDDGSNLLIIEDGESGYGNRIYLYDGYLVEDFGQVDGPLSPKAAIRIALNSVFEIQRVNDELLLLRTDDGAVYIHTGKRSSNEQ